MVACILDFLVHWKVPPKRVIPSLTYDFVIILKILGCPARLSLTAIDFVQKLSDHDIVFSFKVVTKFDFLKHFFEI